MDGKSVVKEIMQEVMGDIEGKIIDTFEARLSDLEKRVDKLEGVPPEVTPLPVQSLPNQYPIQAEKPISQGE